MEIQILLSKLLLDKKSGKSPQMYLNVWSWKNYENHYLPPNFVYQLLLLT